LSVDQKFCQSGQFDPGLAARTVMSAFRDHVLLMLRWAMPPDLFWLSRSKIAEDFSFIRTWNQADPGLGGRSGSRKRAFGERSFEKSEGLVVSD
jgi:hypothetical protein